ncbi:MAG: insulinase family protein [Holosporaceae bacterium]|nr:insulinase family protein [Holosporaceae bacterium]
MIKKILSALLIFFQTIWCGQTAPKVKFAECIIDDGSAVILCENFRMPIVVVGLLFDVGSLDAPLNKFGVAEIVAENMINSKAQEQLRSLGISCSAIASETYTEVLAEMHPKYVKKFFEIMRENFSKFSVTNLEIQKKQMIVDRRLADYYSEDIVKNEIFSHIKLKNKNAANQIFKEKSLQSITEGDVKQFFANNYLDCHLAIIVSGALNLQNLLENLPPMKTQRHRRGITDDFCKNDAFRNVLLESKHIGRSLRYFYKIPSKQNNNLSDIFFCLFNCEVFKFFKKMNPLLVDYRIRSILDHGDCLQEVCLYPREDVTLDQLQKAYDFFVNRIRKTPFSRESFAKIARMGDYEHRFLCSSPQELYLKVRNLHMAGKNINSIYKIEDNIKNVRSQALKAFGEKVLGENLIFKITTKYNARSL